MAVPLGFAEKFPVDDAASDQSSSSLSPPPDSSTPHNLHNHNIIGIHPQLGGGVANPAANSAQPISSAAHANNHTTSAHAPAPGSGAEPETKKRASRKKKEVGSDGKPLDDGKPKDKKQRAPRKIKDPDAPPTASRKRKADDAPAASRPLTLTEMVNRFQPPKQQPLSNLPPQPQHRPSLGLPTSNPQTPRPISSGQNYDPIRGYDPRATTMETAQQRPVNASNGAPLAQASAHVNRASASPSIASLIDPPMALPKTSAPAPAYQAPTTMPIQQQHFTRSPPRSPTPPKPTPAAFAHPPRPKSPPPPFSISKAAVPATMDGAMEVDLTCDTRNEVKKAPSNSSSSAPTPKAARPTPPVIQGTGSGLLSGSDLFGGPSTNKPTERRGVNIDIRIKLNPAGGNTINIAQEIAKKYGRDAINPRAAAHREQLRQMMAMANKLDAGAADDMDVDLTSEPGDDSNIEMGGMDSGTADAADAKPKRQRRKKVEEYDKEDEFIDDTELAWQEQAAVAKDGFFVYSGPLIPPGETANVESSAPARGSGRGRGSRGGKGSRGGGQAGATHASVAEKNRDSNAPTRARGRGRGTSAPRKPRITKADRERMEAEKVDRERAGQHIGGPTGAPITLAPTPQQAAVAYGGPTGTML